MFYKKLEDVMIDSDIPAFFKRATGREYTSKETCVNDLRRICALFWNEQLKKRLEHTHNSECTVTPSASPKLTS